MACSTTSGVKCAIFAIVSLILSHSSLFVDATFNTNQRIGSRQRSSIQYPASELSSSRSIMDKKLTTYDTVKQSNSKQRTVRRSFSMQYSESELSTLRRITDKKLGAKISRDYLLVSTIMKPSQSRSEILDCIAQADLSLDKDIRFKAKIVKEQDRFDREFKNYQTVCGKQKGMKEFISIERFEKNALAKPGAKFTSSTAGVMIMEAGVIDLKKASAELGPVRDRDLVRIAKSMAASLAKIQGKGLVWTDLKTDNFVFVPNTTSAGSDSNDNNYFGTSYTCKAIDLESAVEKGKAIVDFSPEIAAPEQIDILMGGELSSQGGRATDYTLAISEPILSRKETDIWALGISILHMYLGRAPITDRSDMNSCVKKIKEYQAGKSDLGLSEVTNDNLKKLLTSMLNLDAKKRPSIGMVQLALNFCG